MRRTAVVLALFLTLACSTSNRRPATVAAPTIVATGVGSIFFGSGATAPVTLEVSVRNNAQVPIRVRDVEVSSPGMVQYTLRPVSRMVNENILPGETRSITLFTTAHTSVRSPREPLNLRTIVTLEAQGVRWREIVQ